MDINYKKLILKYLEIKYNLFLIMIFFGYGIMNLYWVDRYVFISIKIIKCDINKLDIIFL